MINKSLQTFTFYPLKFKRKSLKLKIINIILSLLLHGIYLTLSNSLNNWIFSYLWGFFVVVSVYFAQILKKKSSQNILT